MDLNLVKEKMQNTLFKEYLIVKSKRSEENKEVIHSTEKIAWICWGEGSKKRLNLAQFYLLNNCGGKVSYGLNIGTREMNNRVIKSFFVVEYQTWVYIFDLKESAAVPSCILFWSPTPKKVTFSHRAFYKQQIKSVLQKIHTWWD